MPKVCPPDPTAIILRWEGGEVGAVAVEGPLSDTEATTSATMGTSQASTISPTNPINGVLRIEAEVVRSSDIDSAWHFLVRVIDRVKGNLSSLTSPTPETQLKTVYKTLDELGAVYRDQDDRSFSLRLKTRSLDDGVASLVVLAVAHELGLPVRLVHVFEHTFIRYDDGKIKFNIADRGEIVTDDEWLEHDRGVDFSGLNMDGVKALVYSARARDRYDRKFYSESVSDCDEAIRLDPRVAEYYYDRGDTLHKLGKLKEALRDYTQAIELSPNYYDAYLNRGLVKRKLGRIEDAIRDYDEAIRLRPDITDAYFNRGTANFLCIRYHEAIADFDRIIELDTQNAKAYLMRGQAKDRLGQTEEAIRDLVRAKKLAQEQSQTN